MQGGKKERAPQCTACVFTVNNYSEQTLDTLATLFAGGTIQYLLVGKEVGESGTPHLQGYLQFKKRSRFAKLATDLKGHFEVAKGTLAQNQEYCRKEGNWYELGEAVDRDSISKSQGEKEKAR